MIVMASQLLLLLYYKQVRYFEVIAVASTIHHIDTSNTGKVLATHAVMTSVVQQCALSAHVHVLAAQNSLWSAYSLGSQPAPPCVQIAARQGESSHSRLEGQER